MDKKSNRTDLLAAGRKKLEQYQQKSSKGKGSKGKRGKSSSKSTSGADNSEQHDDDIEVVTSTNAPHNLPQKELLLQPDSESSSSAALLEMSIDSTLNEPVDSASSVPILDDKNDDKALSIGDVEDSNEIKALPSISKEDERRPAHSIYDERAALGISMLETVNADPHPSTTSSASTLCADEDVLKKEDQELPGSGLKDGDRSIDLGQQDEVDLSLAETSMSSGKSDSPCIVADAENDVKEGYDSFASGSVGQAVSLMKLADMIKGLSEDDFTYLINSRKVVNSSVFSARTEHCDIYCALLEHLYVASIFQEFLNLQLLEASKHEADMDHKHNQLAIEISWLTASLDDFNERNKNLFTQLGECRAELKVAICEKEELQSEHYSANAKVVELSSKVDEMKITIEASSKSSLELLEELDCCKRQLADSLAENQSLINKMMSITEEKNIEMVLKEQLNDDKLSRELTGCRSSIDALEAEIASLNVSLAFITDERMTKLNANLIELRERIHVIKEAKDNLVNENKRLSHEVSVYQDRLSEEHAQFMQLEENLTRDRLHHEKLIAENIGLTSTLEIYKGKIVEISSRESKSSQVGVVGNGDWGCANVANVEDCQNISQRTIIEPLSSISTKPALDESEERLYPNHLVGDIYDDFSGFVMLKGHLEEAEQLLQDLDKGTEGMRSHSIALSRSFGRSAAPGISKLIQAFEAKPQSGENESETSQTAGDDLYMLVKQYSDKLGLLLKAMHHDIVHAIDISRDEKESHQSAKTSLGELSSVVKSWKDYCANVGLHNIELEVQYEVMKQHMSSMEVRNIELETLYEASRGNENSLRSQNFHQAEKLRHYHSRFTELSDQLDEVQKISGEIASHVHNDLEGLKKDMTEKICKLEGALESSFSRAAQVVEKLDAVVASPLVSPNPAGFSDGMDSDDHILISVNAACQVIENLKERLETASRENQTLSETYEDMRTKFDALTGDKMSAIDLLQKVSAHLRSCLLDASGHAEESDIEAEELAHYAAIDAGHFETIITQISSLLSERQQLKKLNDSLHSELLSRTNDEEELKKRSFDSDLLLKLVENVTDLLKLTPEEINSDEPSLSLLQSLILLLVGKYKDADERTRLLRDDLHCTMIELEELQECVESLNSFNFQQQNEILVLKESLKHAKDAFDITQDHLLMKSAELEHCEQRVLSIREKLSIAVAKGKGLIVQRDSLKQSLSETSTELEKCSQELQLKEARLNEVEHKLKEYSEAAERIEALESELSYIRNSATALRESFLLKDSALQRIEEILEEFELPENFHSRDIVEKVNYLAKTVAANSFLAADWDQKSPIGGGSFSDAGIVETDTRNVDANHSLNPVVDLRRQYDEMKNKYFALAEQNEMLEQSLIERNNLVQRWEGVLDRIDAPVQIRSMEPDGRIQWLGTALSEADHHMSSLQQKVDNLENYCGSIATELEESERRVSESEFSLQTVTCERDDLERSVIERNSILQRMGEVLDRIDTPLPVKSMELDERIQWLGTAFSEADYHMKSLQQKVDGLETSHRSINAELGESRTHVAELQFSLEVAKHEKETLLADLAGLKSDHDKSVVTTAQFQQVIDDLKTEVDSLQSKLAENLVTENHILQIKDQMLRWQDLIVGTLQSCGTESLISDGSSLDESLEFLIQRLVDEYTRFRTETYGSKETIDNMISCQTTDLDKMTVLCPVNVDMHDCDNSNPHELRERNAMVEEVQSAIDLRRELDDAMGEMAYLKEEREEYMKRSQSLVNELEESERQKEEVQKQLNQEEQKSASLREKLNVAVKKGKSLVQHRDALKQSIEGFTAEIDSLKSELKMRDDCIAVFEHKIHDLSSQIEISHATESENTSLRNQLLETKQHLLEREHTMSLLLGKLDEINIDSELDVSNPVQKLEEIQKVCSNLHDAVVSSEREMKKAKRAAELLLSELNEVQERNDNLQENLSKACNEISELSGQKHAAESAKLQVISRLQELSEETRNHRAEYDLLRSYVHKLGRGFCDFSSVIADVFVKDMDLLHRLRANLDACVEAIGSDLQLPRVSHVPISWVADKKGCLDTYSLWGSDVLDQPDDLGAYLSKLTTDIEKLKQHLCSDFLSLHEEAELLLNFIGDLHSEAISLKKSFNSIKAEYINLESVVKKQDAECTIMHQCISSLYEVCCQSIMEIENRIAQVVGNGFPAEEIDSKLKGFPLGGGGINFNEQGLLTSTENVKILGNRVLSAVKDFGAMYVKSLESDHKEMRAAISNLQKELQEKDVQKERMGLELVSQIRKAEATAKGYSCDLQSAQVHVHDLEKRLQLIEEERNLLESRISDMQQAQVASVELQDKVSSLSGMVAAKEQEIEALMEALDEEENQIEGLKVRVEELEMNLMRKSQDLDQALDARTKVSKKLSITVSKFDELHHMSEGLLSEVENLQTQLQERESEISFLRQEVTRCTNDALLASKTAKERNANELQDLLKWLETTLSQVIVHDIHSGDTNNNQNIEQKDHLQKSIASIIAELEELRITAQRKDALLQAERNRIEELSREKEAMEASVRVMESHLSSLTSAGESGQSVSEIVEVESTMNKRMAPVTSTASQVRSLRKSNNDQVAVVIDTDTTGSGRIEDEDDDKVHGFKSLTTSRFVPKFTRPVSDMIDGLWVSCDRTLMRQPGMRLGIMIYWAILHALLATFVV